MDRGVVRRSIGSIGPVPREGEHAEEAPRTSQDGTEEATRAQEAPDAQEVGPYRARALKPLFALEAGPSRALSALLTAGWGQSLKNGIVSYDPETTERCVVSPFSFHHLPQRGTRPRKREDAPPVEAGVRAAHESCLFDAPEFVRARELAWIERASRRYVLVANRYPVRSRHFLAVRPAEAPAERLPQYLQGPEELEDAFLLLTLLAPEYRVYFNSNRGADGSFSGSSVNHWHLHFFPAFDESPSTLLTGPTRIVDHDDGVTVGFSSEWPAHNVFVECPPEAVTEGAALLWDFVEQCNIRNCAYNVEAVALEEGRLRAYLFPRRPASPLEIPGVGTWSPNMGGCELEGHFVVPSPELFDWARTHPDRADAVTRTRLLSTTWRPLAAAAGPGARHGRR